MPRHAGFSTLTVAALALSWAGLRPLAAQNQPLPRQYTDADIAYGASLYAAQCATCHAPTGDGVGGVDLRSGRFRNASTDQELTRVITTGVQGTGMVGFKLDPP